MTYLQPPDLPPEPRKAMPYSKTSRLPPQAQTLLCRWLFLVALCDYRQETEADSKTRPRSIKAFWPPTSVFRQSLA